MNIPNVLTATANLFNGTTLPEIGQIYKYRPMDQAAEYPALYIYMTRFDSSYEAVQAAMTEYTIGMTVYHKIEDHLTDNEDVQIVTHNIVDKIRKLVNKSGNLGGACEWVSPVSGSFRFGATPSILYVAEMTFTVKSVEQFV